MSRTKSNKRSRWNLFRRIYKRKKKKKKNIKFVEKAYMKEGTIYNKLEKFVDRAIPFLVIILLLIIVGELFYEHTLEEYNLLQIVHSIDTIIVGFFIADLIFKYNRIRNMKYFITHYWLDILAVFPFLLVFRMFEALTFLFPFARTVSESQKYLHEGVELHKGASKIGRELAEIEKLGQLQRLQRLQRITRITRVIRIVQRIPRVLKIIPHLHRKKQGKDPSEQKWKPSIAAKLVKKVQLPKKSRKITTKRTAGKLRRVKKKRPTRRKKKLSNSKRKR